MEIPGGSKSSKFGTIGPKFSGPLAPTSLSSRTTTLFNLSTWLLAFVWHFYPFLWLRQAPRGSFCIVSSWVKQCMEVIQRAVGPCIVWCRVASCVRCRCRTAAGRRANRGLDIPPGWIPAWTPAAAHPGSPTRLRREFRSSKTATLRSQLENSRRNISSSLLRMSEESKTLRTDINFRSQGQRSRSDTPTLMRLTETQVR